MSSTDIFEKALALPELERAELALRLLESLGPGCALYDDAGLAEIRRRVEDVRSGRSPGISWEEVYAEAKDRLRR